MTRGGRGPHVTVDQVANAITHLGERGGSSLAAIRNVLKQEYSGASDITQGQLKRLLVRGVQQGKLRVAASASGGRFVLKNLTQSSAVGRQARKSASHTSGGV
nr:hypothetical protein BaRGS_012840 [Batillaria attramentaria]